MTHKGNSEPPTTREQYLEKPLPSSEESERVILGAILLDNLLVHQAAARLTPLHFYSPLNRRVFAAMLILKQHGKPIDPILIGEELKKEGSLEAIGGTTTITNMTFGMPRFSDITEYITVVVDKFLVRELIRLCNNVTSQALAEEEDAREIAQKAVTSLVQLAGGDRTESAHIRDVAAEVLSTFEAWEAGNTNVSSVATGIPELDGYLKYKGVSKGELMLIGGRPSLGKTAILLQLATHAIRKGTPTLFLSLEMLKTKIVMRMLPAISGVYNKSINPETFKKLPEEAAKLKDALETVRELPMYFDRSSTLDKLISTAEWYIETKGIEYVIFDYLTLIHAGVISRRQDTRDTEVGYVTDALKQLGLRKNVAVLGAAQMNRESDRPGSKPTIKGFRESGAIEQIVDTAIFPYDPEAKNNALNPEATKDGLWLNLYCDKQRDGSRYWEVPVYYDKNLQIFESELMNRDRRRPAQTQAAAPAPSAPPTPYKNFYEPKENDPDF